MIVRTIHVGEFEADIYKDTKYGLYHFVVTRQGDAEIVMWGQEASLEEAEQVAKDWMKAFGKRASHAG